MVTARIPTKSYVICAASRSGSTLLADSLMLTGVAGDAQEYFAALADPPHPAQLKWYSTDDSELIRRMITLGTTPNGVFGVKVHWHQLPEASRRLRRLLRDEGCSEVELLARVFPATSYIWVQRRDKIAQAISFYRAIRTGRWSSFRRIPSAHGTSAPPPDFSVEEISVLLELCVRSELGWEEFFERNRIDPLIVVYEDFIQNYEATISGVLRYIGLSLEGVVIAEPRLVRQADEVSSEWCRRFREAKYDRTIA